MKRVLHPAIFLFAALLLGACATTGQGNGYGDGYGNQGGTYYPGGYGNQYGSQRFIGTVQGVDPRYGRLLLSVGNSRDYRSSQVEVFFDNRTPLYYQGRQYPVGGLERGDQVSVEAVQSNGRLWARQIQLVRNIRDSGGYRY